MLVAFLLARRRAVLRGRRCCWPPAWLFYLWSEPLFVPVVLATCLADYALARAGLARGSRIAAVAAGVA